MILLAHLAAGLLLGAAYFHTGRLTADRLLLGSFMPATISLILARFLLLGAALTFASLEGAMPLLITALGVFAARFLVLRHARLPA